jgi:DNA-directed RNA polymerase specialized sigma24 family protein
MRRKRSHLDTEKNRRRAVEYCITKGWDYEKVARKLKVHRRTVNRYVTEFMLRRMSDRQAAPATVANTGRANNAQERIRITSLNSADRRSYLQVVCKLTTRQRSTFHRYFEDHQTAAEIAASEGVCRTAITRRIARIRAEFHRLGLRPPAHWREGARTRSRNRIRLIQLGAFGAGAI